MRRALIMLPKTVSLVLLLLFVSTCKCEKNIQKSEDSDNTTGSHDQNEGASQLVETKVTSHVPSATRMTGYASTDHQHRGAEVRDNPGYGSRSISYNSQNADGHIASATGGNYGCGSTYGGHEGYGGGHDVKSSLAQGLSGVGTRIGESLGATTRGIVTGIEGLKKLAAAGIQIKTGITKAFTGIPLKVLSAVTSGAAVKANVVGKAVAGVGNAVTAGKGYGGGYGGGGYGGAGYGDGKGTYVTHYSGGKDGNYGGDVYGGGSYGSGKDIGVVYGGKELGGGYGHGTGYESQVVPYGAKIEYSVGHGVGQSNTYVSHGGDHGGTYGGHDVGYN